MADKLVDSWAMQDLVTVNEARKDRGLPPLEDANGKPSADGSMSVAEYKSRKYKAAYTDSSAEVPMPSNSSERKPFKLRD